MSGGQQFLYLDFTCECPLNFERGLMLCSRVIHILAVAPLGQIPSMIIHVRFCLWALGCLLRSAAIASLMISINLNLSSTIYFGITMTDIGRRRKSSLSVFRELESCQSVRNTVYSWNTILDWVINSLSSLLRGLLFTWSLSCDASKA